MDITIYFQFSFLYQAGGTIKWYDNSPGIAAADVKLTTN